MTLLKFKNKYVIQSSSAVNTTSSSMQDDSYASQTFTLSATQTVLAIYQASNNNGTTETYMGHKMAVKVDSADYCIMNDGNFDSNYPARNMCFWVGTLAAGEHTIKGRYASGSNGSTVTISNRILTIIIFDGDEFRYSESSTKSQYTSSYNDDISVTFTPSGACKALAMYAACYDYGAGTNNYGQHIAVNIGGTDYATCDKMGGGSGYPNSETTFYATSLSASSTTVKGRAGPADPSGTTQVCRRALAVLLFDNSTLIDVVNDSTNDMSRNSTTLADDSYASISRTTTDARELLALAMGTERYNNSSTYYGFKYGIMVDSSDKQQSQCSSNVNPSCNSASTCYAMTTAAAAHTIKGRWASIQSNYTHVNARTLIALWFSSSKTYTQTIDKVTATTSAVISNNRTINKALAAAGTIAAAAGTLRGRLMAAVARVSGVAGAPGANLLYNGGFETDTVENTFESLTVETGTVTINNWNRHSGALNLDMNTAGRKYGYFKPVAISGGDAVSAGIWVWSTVPTSTDLTLKLYETGGDTTTFENTTLTSGWNHFTLTKTASPTATAVKLYFDITLNGNFDVFFDDASVQVAAKVGGPAISLRATYNRLLAAASEISSAITQHKIFGMVLGAASTVAASASMMRGVLMAAVAHVSGVAGSPGPNLLYNPGFETDTVENTFEALTVEEGSVSIGADKPRTGTKGLILAMWGEKYGRFKSVPISGGSTVTADAWICSMLPDKTDLTLQLVETGGDTTSFPCVVTESFQWTHFTITKQAAAGATAVALAFDLKINANFTIYMDDFTLQVSETSGKPSLSMTMLLNKALDAVAGVVTGAIAGRATSMALETIAAISAAASNLVSLNIGMAVSTAASAAMDKFRTWSETLAASITGAVGSAKQGSYGRVVEIVAGIGPAVDRTFAATMAKALDSADFLGVDYSSVTETLKKFYRSFTTAPAVAVKVTKGMAKALAAALTGVVGLIANNKLSMLYEQAINAVASISATLSRGKSIQKALDAVATVQSALEEVKTRGMLLASSITATAGMGKSLTLNVLQGASTAIASGIGRAGSYARGISSAASAVAGIGKQSIFARLIETSATIAASFTLANAYQLVLAASATISSAIASGRVMAKELAAQFTGAVTAGMQLSFRRLLAVRATMSRRIGRTFKATMARALDNADFLGTGYVSNALQAKKFYRSASANARPVVKATKRMSKALDAAATIVTTALAEYMKYHPKVSMAVTTTVAAGMGSVRTIMRALQATAHATVTAGRSLSLSLTLAAEGTMVAVIGKTKLIHQALTASFSALTDMYSGLRYLLRMDIAVPIEAGLGRAKLIHRALASAARGVVKRAQRLSLDRILSVSATPRPKQRKTLFQSLSAAATGVAGIARRSLHNVRMTVRSTLRSTVATGRHMYRTLAVKARATAGRAQRLSANISMHARAQLRFGLYALGTSLLVVEQFFLNSTIVKSLLKLSGITKSEPMTSEITMTMNLDSRIKYEELDSEITKTVTLDSIVKLP